MQEARYYVGPVYQRPETPPGIEVSPFVEFNETDWSFITDKRDALVIFADDRDHWLQFQALNTTGFKKAIFDENMAPLQGYRCRLPSSSLVQQRQPCGTWAVWARAAWFGPGGSWTPSAWESSGSDVAGSAGGGIYGMKFPRGCGEGEEGADRTQIEYGSPFGVVLHLPFQSRPPKVRPHPQTVVQRPPKVKPHPRNPQTVGLACKQLHTGPPIFNVPVC